MAPITPRRKQPYIIHNELNHLGLDPSSVSCPYGDGYPGENRRPEALGFSNKKSLEWCLSGGVYDEFAVIVVS